MEQRRGGMRALAGEVARIAAPVLGKRGLAPAHLVASWSSIVGSEWAEKATPERLSFPSSERGDGTLRLRVAPGCATELQHRAPLLLERINGFFGYRAVTRLTLVQGPPLRPSARPPRKPAPLAPDERAALDRRLLAVEDPDLRDALRRLGEAVIGSDRER
ncbi:MAG TPA: DciA family protein [Stellaceae bacterium]|nr:DciA family protein [Stellaceae bacterium]